MITSTSATCTNYMVPGIAVAPSLAADLLHDADDSTEVGSTGQKLTGANRYIFLTFAKGLTPPVNAFWSITMYEIDQGWWFVPNPLNKFTVSMRDKPTFNPDGSLTLYFQNESPVRIWNRTGCRLPRASSGHDAHVLAEREDAVDPERHVETVGHQESLSLDPQAPNCGVKTRKQLTAGAEEVEPTNTAEVCLWPLADINRVEDDVGYQG